MTKPKVCLTSESVRVPSEDAALDWAALIYDNLIAASECGVLNDLRPEWAKAEQALVASSLRNLDAPLGSHRGFPAGSSAAPAHLRTYHPRPVSSVHSWSQEKLGATSTMKLPQSVFRYLSDPVVRDGVDALGGRALIKVPSCLSWSGLPHYYGALLAATTVQVEWAVTLERLWQEVWSEGVPGWTPLALGEQIHEHLESDISVRGCWSEGAFGRWFVRLTAGEEARLCLSVSLSIAGISIGYAHQTKANHPAPRVHGFHFDDDRDGWWTEPQEVGWGTFNLSQLREAATQLIRTAGG